MAGYVICLSIRQVERESAVICPECKNMDSAYRAGLLVWFLRMWKSFPFFHTKNREKTAKKIVVI